MTREQFERFKDLAVRMARTCFPWLSERRRERLVEELEGFFAIVEPYHREYGDWDGYLGEQRGLYPIGDAVSEHWEHEWRSERQEMTTFPTAIRCCLRSGADMAVQQSAGVMGFTVGDLRAMYPEGLPGWLSEGWNLPVDSAPDTAGILL